MLARSRRTCPFDGAAEPGKLTVGFAFVSKPLLQFLPVDILIRRDLDSLVPALWILPVDGRCETIHDGLRGRNYSDLPNANVDDRTILVTHAFFSPKLSGPDTNSTYHSTAG